MIKENITIIFQPPKEIKTTFQPTQQVNLEMRDKITFSVPVEHNLLRGLDFENSGHTGFASEKELNEFKENVNIALRNNVVLGVKGEANSEYRLGKVNITRADIGLQNVLNVASYSKVEVDNELNEIKKSMDEIEEIAKNPPIDLSGFATKLEVASGLLAKEDKSKLGLLAYKNELTKSDVGLSNVDNTRDLDKPISTAVQNTINQINSLINDVRSLVDNNEQDLESKILNINSNIDIIRKDIDSIELILTSNDTDLDTLQELVNALKSNVSSVNDIFERLSKKANVSDIPTHASQLINDVGFLTQVPSEYVTDTELNKKGYLTNKDITHKADIVYVDEKFNSIKIPEVDLSDYAKLDDLPTKTSDLINDSGFLTKHQDLSEYAKKSELPKKVSELENDNNYLVLQDLNSYAKKSDIPIKVSQLINDNQYITLQDVSNKVDKSDVYTKSEIDDSFSIRDTNISNAQTSSTNALNKANQNETNILSLDEEKEDKANLVITTEVGTSQAIGGIPKGTVLKGKTVRDVIEEMLFPYIKFSMNVQSVSPTGTYEKGTSVTIKSVTVRITAGTKPVTNIKLYESNKTTLLGEKTSGIATDNTFSINKTVSSSVSFYATATDGVSNVSDSSSFLAFYDPTFYGVLDVGYTLSSDLITGKSKELKANKSNTRTYNATNQHPFLAYPSSYGTLTSIKDGNGFECIGDFNTSTLNLTVKSGTVSYRVYVLKSATTGTGYKYIFS